MRYRYRLLTIIVFIGWMGLVLAAFYAVQKPITAEDAAAITQFQQAFTSTPSLLRLFDSLVNVFVVLVLCAAAVLMGFRLSPLAYPLADASLVTRGEFWLLNIGLGFGAISLITFALALTGWLNAILISVMGAILLLLSRRAIRLLLRDLLSLRTSSFPSLLIVFLIVSVLLALLTALTPPTAWDALVYHLAVPRRALEIGRLAPSGEIIPHENFPMLMSSLYLLAMLVKGDIAAQLIHFVFGLLTLALIATSARQFYSRAALPFSLAIALSMPMLLLLATWAYNDLALAFYTLAAVYCYRRYELTHASRFLSMSALMAGLALGLKYTSFVLPISLIALMWWQQRVQWLRPAVYFSTVTLLVALPWYLKNFFFSGNPVYPFIFGGAYWDSMRSAWFARGGTGIGFDLGSLITLPLVVTLGYRDANFYDGRVGPLMLMFAPLLMIHRQRLDSFVFVFLLHFAFWVIGVMGSLSLWQSRLLLPALVLLAPPLGQAVVNLSRFDHPHFSLKRLVTMAIGLVLAMTLFTQTIQFLAINPLAYLVGAESRELFLRRQMDEHAAALFAINDLPSSARVQFMWEPRSYLAVRSLRADPLLDALPHLIATNGNLDAGVQRLKGEGFTHILVFEAGVNRALQLLPDQFSEVDLQNLRRLENDYARVIYENSGYRLMEIK